MSCLKVPVVEHAHGFVFLIVPGPEVDWGHTPTRVKATLVEGRVNSHIGSVPNESSTLIRHCEGVRV